MVKKQEAGSAALTDKREPEEANAYSVRETCRRYSVGKTFLYAEIKEGRLKARKAGRRTLIAADDAARWFQNLPEHV